jgi:hypothetical protein
MAGDVTHRQWKRGRAFAAQQRRACLASQHSEIHFHQLQNQGEPGRRCCSLPPLAAEAFSLWGMAFLLLKAATTGTILLNAGEPQGTIEWNILKSIKSKLRKNDSTMMSRVNLRRGLRSRIALLHLIRPYLAKASVRNIF